MRLFVQVVAQMRQLCNLVVTQTGPPCPHNVTRGTEPPFAAGCCCGHTQTMPGYCRDHRPGCFLSSPPFKSVPDFARRIEPLTNKLLDMLVDEAGSGIIDFLMLVKANALQDAKEFCVAATFAPALLPRLFLGHGLRPFVL